MQHGAAVLAAGGLGVPVAKGRLTTSSPEVVGQFGGAHANVKGI